MGARAWGRVLVALWLVGMLSGCKGFMAKTRTYGEDQRASELRTAELEKQCTALEARQITVEEEYSFGGAVSVNWVSQGGGLVLSKPGLLDKDRERDPAWQLNVQLNKIGKNLAAQSRRPSLSWTFGVLKSPGLNAVSGPGGYVFVSEGLLAQLGSEAELAGVLAHEITHITHKHALNEFHAYLNDECQEQVSTERHRVAWGLGAAALGDAKQEVSRGLGSLAQTVGPSAVRDFFARVGNQVNGFDAEHAGKAIFQAFTNNFVARLSDRGLPEQAEYDADQGAVELMAAAGYDPQAYIEFLGKLPDTGLSTAHPRKDRRQRRLRERLAALSTPAPGDAFTSPVDLSRVQRLPLRDALLLRSQAPSKADP